ncbi:MAG: hypothetical protein LBS70_10395 [Candidatus Accumulibacter sp.]|jgi:hypothetical protein|nr:hypothetical protein [Accumulibacter sp.]
MDEKTVAPNVGRTYLPDIRSSNFILPSRSRRMSGKQADLPERGNDMVLEFRRAWAGGTPGDGV